MLNDNVKLIGIVLIFCNTLFIYHIIFTIHIISFFVGLHGSLGYRMNFWVALDPYDPDGQLQWLINELADSEINGQKVMIVNHIPPSTELVKSYLHNYIRILDRFQHLITAHYYGHTHLDEVFLVKSNLGNNQTKSVSVAYVAPSLTTYSRLNPGYRIFTLDGNVSVKTTK